MLGTTPFQTITASILHGLYKILSLWVNSCNAGLRITCKLLASSVLMFLDEEHLHFLDMSDSDISSLLTAVDVAASSPDSTAEAFGYRYSLLELLQALHHISCSTVNFQKIAKPSLIFCHLLPILFREGIWKRRFYPLGCYGAFWRFLNSRIS